MGEADGRRWTIWRCDNCGDFPEVELGEVCEFCCEGTQTAVEVAPVAVEEELREALRVEIQVAADFIRGGKPRAALTTLDLALAALASSPAAGPRKDKD